MCNLQFVASNFLIRKGFFFHRRDLSKLSYNFFISQGHLNTPPSLYHQTPVLVVSLLRALCSRRINIGMLRIMVRNWQHLRFLYITSGTIIHQVPEFSRRHKPITLPSKYQTVRMLFQGWGMRELTHDQPSHTSRLPPPDSNPLSHKSCPRRKMHRSNNTLPRGRRSWLEDSHCLFRCSQGRGLNKRWPNSGAS